MKIFDLQEVPAKSPALLAIQKQAVEMIIEICKALEISLPAMHASLWVFHCNALIMGFGKFDRYIYACGAVLVGTKLMECLRYPTSILGECRKSLRRRKKLDEDVDSDQYLKKEVKRVFEAEVNIMINIGFDFDIKLGLQESERLDLFLRTRSDGFDHFATKLKQTLTSLYLTEVVVLFSAETIALAALKILLKVENRNIDVMEFDPEIKLKMQEEEVKLAQKEYLQRCAFY